MSAYRLTRRTITSLLLLTVVACSNASDTPNSKSQSKEDKVQTSVSASQQFYFAITYDNWAWSAQHRSMSVESDGNIYVTPVNPQEKLFIENTQQYTAEQLSSRFTFEYFSIGNIAQKQLADKVKLIAKIDNTDLTEGVSKCADAGNVSFWAFKFDPQTALYEAVLLSSRGDWARFNQAEAAKGLTLWLANIMDSAKDQRRFPLLDQCE